MKSIIYGLKNLKTDKLFKFSDWQNEIHKARLLGKNCGSDVDHLAYKLGFYVG
jgi:hypothetical protein